MIHRTNILYRIIIVLLISDVFCNEASWLEYKQEFGKKYEDPVEDSKRQKIFEENLLKIQENNEEYDKGSVTYKMGINEFLDVSDDEFSETFYTDFDIEEDQQRFRTDFDIDVDEDEYFMYSQSVPFENQDVPESIDWRDKGAVTNVKHQGYCGSCWAFCLAGILEGQMAIHHDVLESLSAQQLVDCDTRSNGCHNGSQYNALDHYIKENGLMTDQDYPYVGQKQSCKLNSTGKTNRVFPVYYDKLRNVTEDYLKLLVGLIGPVGVHILPSKNFTLYKNDIFENCKDNPNGNRQGNRHIIHSILVVGYGKDERTGMMYWILKNSWGEGWGDKGYVKMKMGYNICEITRYPVYVNNVKRQLVDETKPNQAKVEL